jgi:hypothetical protein
VELLRWIELLGLERQMDRAAAAKLDAAVGVVSA